VWPSTDGVQFERNLVATLVQQLGLGRAGHRAMSASQQTTAEPGNHRAEQRLQRRAAGTIETDGQVNMQLQQHLRAEEKSNECRHAKYEERCPARRRGRRTGLRV
jgi:hypothetical protein